MLSASLNKTFPSFLLIAAGCDQQPIEMEGGVSGGDDHVREEDGAESEPVLVVPEAEDSKWEFPPVSPVRPPQSDNAPLI